MQSATRPHNSTAVLMPNWLGDCLCALAVINSNFPREQAGPALIVPPQFVGLLTEFSDYFLIPYKRKNHEELKESFALVRKENFESVYIVPHSFSSALFALRSGIPYRVGIGAELRSLFLTRRVSRSAATRKNHITSEYASVLEAGNFDPAAWGGVQINKDIRYDDYIVFCPGARYGPAKRWPGYKELALIFGDKRILLLGDTRDWEQADDIATRAPERITNLAGVTSLVEAARIIAGAEIVISNDSGLMHLAGFLGTPVVGLFCSTSPAWTHPLGKASLAAAAEIQCRPCFKRTCKYGHYKCHSLITPERVAELAAQAMKDEKE
ncbi:MAG: lipopolysaccharide heptosyltransferase II [Chitinivibrionales bacterium]|nr:lipopolysaccharide heptosyltransferase II [Chitinivibrionales bacterium]